MKKNSMTLGVAALLWFVLGITACAPDYETDFDVKTLEVTDGDLATIHFAIEGGKKDVKVKTNVPADMWTAASNADWCNVEKQGDKVIVSANQNKLFTPRRALVTIAYGHQSYSIDVMQTGHEASILIDGHAQGLIKEVGVNGGEISVTVESNVVIDHISIPDTSAWVKMTGPIIDDGTKKTLNFVIESSYAPKDRFSAITLQSSQNYLKAATFVIKQEKRVWGTPIPVPLTVDMLSANATEPSEGSLAALLDNDKSTFYHTLWSKPSPGGKPHYLQIELNTPLKYVRFEYDGRANGNNGDPSRVGIWVSQTGADGDGNGSWKKAATISFPLIAGNGNHYVANEVAVFDKPYKYIRFIPEARRNANPIDSSGKNGWWYAANLFLYTFAE